MLLLLATKQQQSERVIISSCFTDNGRNDCPPMDDDSSYLLSFLLMMIHGRRHDSNNIILLALAVMHCALGCCCFGTWKGIQEDDDRPGRRTRNALHWIKECGARQLSICPCVCVVCTKHKLPGRTKREYQEYHSTRRRNMFNSFFPYFFFLYPPTTTITTRERECQVSIVQNNRAYRIALQSPRQQTIFSG